jgi:cytochrome c-type biogenesis protein
MISELPFVTALLAGTLSFLSPCVLPLVPPYLCFMAGARLEDLAAGRAPATGATGSASLGAALPALAFVAGFSTVFVALGAGASSLGGLLRAHLDTLTMIAGVAVLAMGLNFLGVLRIGLFSREARFQAGTVGLAGSFVMGLAFAFGWTPCIGPVLGVILALAAGQETAGQGALLLATYSAGLGIPFLVAALFVGPFLSWLGAFKRHLGTVEKAMGVALVATGVLFLTGGMQRMSYWLLETFPALGTIG